MTETLTIDCWGDFLYYRARVIHYFVQEGQSPTEIASTLSMDPMQVQLISMTSPRVRVEARAQADQRQVFAAGVTVSFWGEGGNSYVLFRGRRFASVDEAFAAYLQQTQEPV